MNWINETLQGVVLHYTGRVYNDRIDNEPKELDIDAAEEAIKDKMLGLIEQSKEKDLPLAWLTKQISEL